MALTPMSSFPASETPIPSRRGRMRRFGLPLIIGLVAVMAGCAMGSAHQVSRVGSLSEERDILRDAVEIFESNAVTAADRITELESHLSEEATRSQARAERVGELEAEVAGHTARVGELEAEVASHSQRVRELESRPAAAATQPLGFAGVPAPAPAKSAVTSFKNCTEARAAGAAPVRRGDPGYGSHLDRDNDGIGCE